MKRLCIVALFFLALLPVNKRSCAWEFTLRGEAEWRYRYISRMGPGDLFGNADIAQSIPGNGTSIGLTGPNARAMRLEGYSSKGADAAYAEQRLWVFPDARINRAIRLRAIVTLQGNVNANYLGGGANWVTNPHYSGWILMDSRDVYAGTGLATPVARAFWGTVQTPWATLSAGTRPAGFGMGGLLHEDDSYARSISLIVPWGPIHFVLSQYLHYNNERTDPNDDRNARRTGLTIASAMDQNEIQNVNSAFSLVYRSGVIDTGALLYVGGGGSTHGRAQFSGTYQDDISASFISQVMNNASHMNNPRIPIYSGGAFFYSGACYFMYNDGRFFFNSEYDFVKIDGRRKGGRPLSGYGQALAVEAGAVVGPARVTLAHFSRSGHDRRGGFFTVAYATGTVPMAPPYRRTYVYDHYDHFIGLFLGGGPGPIDPYCYLLSLYGTGNNSFNLAGACTFEDFVATAARVDYAVAANLNVFGTFMNARRQSNTGTPQGMYTGTWGIGTPQANNPGLGGGTGWTPVPQDPGRPIIPIANVPDNALGWEVDGGLNWRILENLTLKCLFAYWRPGKWFNWAYSDMTISDPVARNYGTVNPSRTISPYMAVQTGLQMEF